MLYTKLKHKTRELKEFTKLGVIDPIWVRDIEIFEEFHALEPSIECKMCRYEIIADQRNVSSDLVRKIVAKMGS